jgi:allophanate hydrolase
VFGGDLISGGSSSWSAVAVASGTVTFALGTDTAGSGRVPAAMNGIVGLKPTRGLIGTSGVLPACRSLDCVSVFTRDVADAAAVLAVLAGPDPDDPWSRPARTLDVPARPRLALADGLDFAGDTAMAAAFGEVAARASAAAASTVHVPVEPLVEAGDLLYTGPWVAERLAGLEGFLADHPGDVLPVTRAVIERGREFTPSTPSAPATASRNCARSATGPGWPRTSCCSRPFTTFTRAGLAEERWPATRLRPLHAVRQPARPRRLAVRSAPRPTGGRSVSPCSGPRSPRPACSPRPKVDQSGADPSRGGRMTAEASPAPTTS